jgi:hypothetical protein
MIRTLLFLLLTPVLALAQELPDEDWFCVTNSYFYKAAGEEEVVKYDSFQQWRFNPSKGVAWAEDARFIGECLRGIFSSEGVTYSCSALTASGHHSFIMNTYSREFQRTLTSVTTGLLLPYASLESGTCTKI